LQFYTDFANPEKNIYSWNKSLPASDEYFSAGSLAFYFGYASELGSIASRNPNLNFLAAEMPQVTVSGFKLTSARVTGIAISQFSKNVNTAFIAANLMASSDFASSLANSLGVTPARRDLLATKPTDAYFPVFYSSALFARSWMDPSEKDTDDIFRRMIDGVLANTFRATDAILDANAKLSLLLNAR